MFWLQIASMALLPFMFAATTAPIPAGTTLPIVLNTTLNAGKNKPGEKIEGKLMQEVQPTGTWTIKKGARVTGHIVRVSKSDQGWSILFQFDQLEDEGQTVRLNVGIRAAASMMSVAQANTPIESTSNTDPENMWTVRQVGGATVNRGRGIVQEGRGPIVGRWTGEGVFAKLMPGESPDCPATSGNGKEQSLWVFSPWACGPYDMEDVKIAQDGRSQPMGQIELKAPKNFKIRGGSAWLIISNGSSPQPRTQ